MTIICSKEERDILYKWCMEHSCSECILNEGDNCKVYLDPYTEDEKLVYRMWVS